MNEKDTSRTSEEQEPLKSDWLFCPLCGNSLPKVQNLKFCIKCGTNLEYIKEHKELPDLPDSNPYKTPVQYPQYSQFQPPRIKYGPPKIPTEDLVNNKEYKLWSSGASIGLPFGAFLVMNLILGGFFALIMFASFDMDVINDLTFNSYFVSFISLFELIFIFFPVIYVRKYLEDPTLKNSLIFLGFTSRGLDRKGIIKESLIGFGLAIIGVLLVSFVSVFVELFVEFIFGIEIITDPSNTTGNVLPMDLPSLVTFSIILILVIGTSEEILFRGFMQKGLVRSLGRNWGIILTAFLFSMVHLINIFLTFSESPFLMLISFLISFFPYFSISLMLGLIYQWRNENLIAVMITHGVYDVLTIILAFFLYGVF
ncbi:MAG: CPBP family glutamic-type intramembrane protease [Promethearchaeota archaeon]|jgi:membrane protease YdiL (CAAX protease family)